MEENITSTEPQANGTNENATAPQVPQEQEKLFTQADVDKIIQERLRKETEKREKAIAEKDAALKAATDTVTSLQGEIEKRNEADKISAMRSAISAETGVPASLITATTEEEARAQAKAIADFARPSSYPSIKDGGEVNKVSKKTNEEIFAEWFTSSMN